MSHKTLSTTLEIIGLINALIKKQVRIISINKTWILSRVI